jgi:hypothetical protein
MNYLAANEIRLQVARIVIGKIRRSSPFTANGVPQLQAVHGRAPLDSGRPGAPFL